MKWRSISVDRRIISLTNGPTGSLLRRLMLLSNTSSSISKVRLMLSSSSYDVHVFKSTWCMYCIWLVRYRMGIRRHDALENVKWHFSEFSSQSTNVTWQMKNQVRSCDNGSKTPCWSWSVSKALRSQSKIQAEAVAVALEDKAKHSLNSFPSKGLSCSLEGTRAPHFSSCNVDLTTPHLPWCLGTLCNASESSENA